MQQDTWYNCGQQGHWSSYCPSKSPNLEERMQQDTCYNCGQRGHWSWFCPSKSLTTSLASFEIASSVLWTFSRPCLYIHLKRQQELRLRSTQLSSLCLSFFTSSSSCIFCSSWSSHFDHRFGATPTLAITNRMDHAMKECETEANTPLPPPLSSTLCSQLTQNQNTQETYPRYSQQDLNARKKNGTCLRCKQQGHWYWECPLIKSSTTIPNTPRTYGVAVAIAVAKENLKESEKPPQGVLCLPHKKCMYVKQFQLPTFF